MCGIGGFVEYDRNALGETATADKMLRSLAPRGPDGGGRWCDPDVCLVHRRLIVIDPQGGVQPMVSPDGSTILIYNGELYNSEELQKDLLQRQHTFRGHSDTEVLLHAFLEWDTAAWERLNGIFAFALWQPKRRRLLLVRDRLGVKPLFYAETKDGLVFGSTIGAVLCSSDIDPVVDADGLRSLLLLGPARPPESGVFRHIHSVLPGHFLERTPEVLQDCIYWSLHAAPHEENEQDTIAHTCALVTDAARRQLVSDVPLCTFLSGGLDSSILSMITAQEFARRGDSLHTWSVDYRDNDRYFTKSNFQPNSDNEYILEMSDFLHTKHHTVLLEPEALCAALLAATDARDLPGMADVDSSLLLFCGQVKKEFTVCLSGECADELFGGYPWYHRDEILFEQAFPWSRSTDLRLGLLQPDVVKDGEEFVRAQYLATCRRAELLPGESARDARMREMFVLNLDWFMATLLEGRDAKEKIAIRQCAVSRSGFYDDFSLFSSFS